MANDRIRIRCKTCQATIMLFKYYPDGGYTNDKETLDTWISKHLYECHPNTPDGIYAERDLGGCCHLELYVESEVEKAE